MLEGLLLCNDVLADRSLLLFKVFCVLCVLLALEVDRVEQNQSIRYNSVERCKIFTILPIDLLLLINHLAPYQDAQQPQNIVGYVVSNRATVGEHGQSFVQFRLIGLEHFGETFDLVEESEQSEDLSGRRDAFFEVVVDHHILELFCIKASSTVLKGFGILRDVAVLSACAKKLEEILEKR